MRVWPSGGLWRHPDFLRLWSAQTISQFGSQVSQLALPLAAILVLDASAFEVALLGTVEFLPFLLFALPAGVWVDRLRRKPILVLGDLGRAVALGSIPVAYAFDALTIWQLYAVGFLVGVGTVFFDVAYQSYLPSLVDRDQLVDGNSKLEVSRSGAALAGPGSRRRAHRSAHRAVRDPGRRGQLRRLGGAARPDPPGRDDPGAHREAEHAPGARRGPPLPARPPLLATARDRPWRCRTSSTRSGSRSSSSTRCGSSSCPPRPSGSPSARERRLAARCRRLEPGLGAPRRRADARRLATRLRARAPPRAGRAAVSAAPLPRRRAHPRELRRHRVQRHRAQLPAGRHSRPPARPAECDPTIHRLGRHPARLAGRRALSLRRSACARRSGSVPSAHR